MAMELVSAAPQIAIPVGFSGKATSLLPATNWHTHTRVRISLVVNNAGAKTVHADGIMRGFTIRLYHGSDPVIELPGHCLAAYLEEMTGAASLVSQFTTASGNETGTWEFLIPRELYDLLDPEATMEDLATGANSRIEFEYNGVTSMIPTAGTTIVSGTIDVEPETIERDPNTPLARILPVCKLQADFVTDLSASSNQQKRKFNTGYIYRRIILLVEDNATTIARSNTLVTAVERIINQAGKGKESFRGIQVKNWHERPQIGRTAPATGRAVFSFDNTHALDRRRLLNLAASLQAEIAFDVGAAANGVRVWIIREMILPPVQKAVDAVKAAAAASGATVQQGRRMTRGRRRTR